jgi:hypothetical protein
MKAILAQLKPLHKKDCLRPKTTEYLRRKTACLQSPNVTQKLKSDVTQNRQRRKVFLLKQNKNMQ